MSERARFGAAAVLEEGAAKPQAGKRKELFQRRQLLEQAGGVVAQLVHRALAPAGRRFPGAPDNS